jgi:hypothetical protein
VKVLPKVVVDANVTTCRNAGKAGAVGGHW